MKITDSSTMKNVVPIVPVFFWGLKNGVMTQFIVQKNRGQPFFSLSPVCPRFLSLFVNASIFFAIEDFSLSEICRIGFRYIRS